MPDDAPRSVRRRAFAASLTLAIFPPISHHFPPSARHISSVAATASDSHHYASARAAPL